MKTMASMMPCVVLSSSIWKVTNDPCMKLLTARRKDMTLDYNRGFVGMTDEAVTLKELIEEREILITDIVGNMPDDHKKFLLVLRAWQARLEAYRPS